MRSHITVTYVHHKTQVQPIELMDVMHNVNTALLPCTRIAMGHQRIDRSPSVHVNQSSTEYIVEALSESTLGSLCKGTVFRFHPVTGVCLSRVQHPEDLLLCLQDVQGPAIHAVHREHKTFLATQSCTVSH